mmetsp:Transcript_11534/g.35706  ORF Transcript_11534/g.35706 Transcript_11534/m.35706 type:complete len:292 (-) Transcript_11534:119-994(-)
MPAAGGRALQDWDPPRIRSPSAVFAEPGAPARSTALDRATAPASGTADRVPGRRFTCDETVLRRADVVGLSCSGSRREGLGSVSSRGRVTAAAGCRRPWSTAGFILKVWLICSCNMPSTSVASSSLASTLASRFSNCWTRSMNPFGQSLHLGSVGPPSAPSVASSCAGRRRPASPQLVEEEAGSSTGNLCCRLPANCKAFRALAETTFCPFSSAVMRTSSCSMSLDTQMSCPPRDCTRPVYSARHWSTAACRFSRARTSLRRDSNCRLTRPVLGDPAAPSRARSRAASRPS